MAPDPELTEPPTLHDRVQALWAFGGAQPAIRDAVRAAGFRRAGRGLVLADDVAFRALAASRTRLRGLADVLAHGARVRTDWQRALVMTDRDVEGDRLSARAVLRTLVTHPETDRLDPIPATGGAFWIDDDLWPRLRLDPADPGKVASLWEVLPVVPGMAGGDRMLRKLVERHEHTLGIDADGRIRAGVARIDPAPTGTAAEVAGEVEAIRARAVARLESLPDVEARWAVGQRYVDRWIDGDEAHSRRSGRNSRPRLHVLAGSA